jgi:hypothetical protein
MLLIASIKRSVMFQTLQQNFVWCMHKGYGKGKRYQTYCFLFFYIPASPFKRVARDS